MSMARSYLSRYWGRLGFLAKCAFVALLLLIGWAIVSRFYNRLADWAQSKQVLKLEQQIQDEGKKAQEAIRKAEDLQRQLDAKDAQLNAASEQVQQLTINLQAARSKRTVAQTDYDKARSVTPAQVLPLSPDELCRKLEALGKPCH